MARALTRRFFIGGAASFGAFSGCRFFESHDSRRGETPSLRFGVVSDIHITHVGADEKMADWGNNLTFRHTLEWFRDQGVDAVVIAGDMADNGIDDHLLAVADAWYAVFPEDRYPDGRPVEKVFVYGNHDWEGFRYGNSVIKRYPDETERLKHILRRDMGGWWKRAFHEDYSPLYRKTIKGFDFIGCHWDRGCGMAADSSGTDPHRRLEAYMEVRGGDFDPARPFFYVQHPHPKDTCYGSWAWGHDCGSVTKCLSAFPNAIAFSGHSHYSLTDERSIWQGEFTSVGTSSLRYTGMPYDAHPPAGYENSSACGKEAWRINAGKLLHSFSPGDCRQGMLWSVYDDCIVVRRREFLSDLDIGENWVMPLPSAESRPFAFAARARAFAAPSFPADATLEVKRGKVKSRGGKSRDGKESVPAVEKEGFRLTAPAAVPDNRARGFSLEFAAEGRDGARRVKLVLAEGFNHAIAHPKATAPTGCAFAKDELPAGEVRFSVTPISCFGKRGAPLFTDWIRS